MTDATRPLELRKRIRAAMPELVELRHELHRHPELAYEERWTSRRIQRELEAAGIEYRAGLAGGTGVIGHIEGAGTSPPIALRADIDALPIEEATGLPYASENAGCMHACGHDGHTTMLLGAARVLADIARTHDLSRGVTLLFQPAEEGAGGAERMLEDGALDGSVLGPRIGQVYGMHGWPGIPLGEVQSRPGPMMAAAAFFDIVVRGVGGHAAKPDETRDPIVAASALVGSLQQLAARDVDPREALVVSVTRIHGGSADNIIPDQVRLGGTVRCFSDAVAARTRERMNAIVDHVSAAFGCTAELEYEQAFPPLVNDATAVGAVERAVRASAGTWAPLERPVMPAEDFAFYGRDARICFFFLGLGAGPSRLRRNSPAAVRDASSSDCVDRTDGVLDDASIDSAAIEPVSLPNEAPREPRDGAISSQSASESGHARAGLHHPAFDFEDAALPLGIEVFCRLALTEAGRRGLDAVAP